MSFLHRCLKVLPVIGVTVLLSACGGGGGDNGAATSSGVDTAAIQSEQALKYQTSVPSDLDARRFLTQATFGPTEAAVSELKNSTLGEWIDRQLTLSPASPSRRSRVTPGRSSTSASRFPTRRLNNVDLPTLGRPMMATTGSAEAISKAPLSPGGQATVI